MFTFVNYALPIVFCLIVLFIIWLKWREHLHMHRHEHGDHSSRTDLMHRDRFARRSNSRAQDSLD